MMFFTFIWYSYYTGVFLVVRYSLNLTQETRPTKGRKNPTFIRYHYLQMVSFPTKHTVIQMCHGICSFQKASPLTKWGKFFFIKNNSFDCMKDTFFTRIPWYNFPLNQSKSLLASWMTVHSNIRIIRDWILWHTSCHALYSLFKD